MQHRISLVSVLAGLRAEGRLRDALEVANAHRRSVRLEPWPQKLSSSAPAPARGRDRPRGSCACDSRSRQHATTTTRR